MSLLHLALTAIILFILLAMFALGYICGRYKIEAKRVEITGSTVDRFKRRMDAPKVGLPWPSPPSEWAEEIMRLNAECDALRSRNQELENQLSDTLKAMDGE